MNRVGERDIENGIRWLHRAADQGHARAAEGIEYMAAQGFKLEQTD